MVRTNTNTTIPGVMGLHNLSNTCYANAVLQALNSVPQFREYIRRSATAARCGATTRRRGAAGEQQRGLRSSRRKGGDENVFDCIEGSREESSGAAVANVTTICGELRELFEEMWAPSKRNAIPPYEMLSAVWGLLPSFSAGLQQDAHEFIRLLLDRLRRELDAAMRSHGGHLEERGGEGGGERGGGGGGGRGEGGGHLEEREERQQSGAACVTSGGQSSRALKRMARDALREKNGGSPKPKVAKVVVEKKQESPKRQLAKVIEEKGFVVTSRWGKKVHRYGCNCRPCKTQRRKLAEAAAAAEEAARAVETTCDDSSNRNPALPVNLSLSASGPVDTWRPSPGRPSNICSPIADDPVSRMFGGVLVGTVECRGCSSKTIIQETFLDLSLSLPIKNEGGSSGLDELLQQYLGDEQISGEEYWCRYCSDAAGATRRVGIGILPDVLCLHLKRFQWCANGGDKIDTHVSFPLNGLEAGMFCKGNGEERSASISYDLAAVITHKGVDMARGHYISYVFHPHLGWLELNDHRVKVVTASTVESVQAYLLFYSRRKGDSPP